VRWGFCRHIGQSLAAMTFEVRRRTPMRTKFRLRRDPDGRGIASSCPRQPGLGKSSVWRGRMGETGHLHIASRDGGLTGLVDHVPKQVCLPGLNNGQWGTTAKTGIGLAQSAARILLWNKVAQSLGQPRGLGRLATEGERIQGIARFRNNHRSNPQFTVYQPKLYGSRRSRSATGVKRQDRTNLHEA